MAASNVTESFGDNWDDLKEKYAGTGHPDITKYEWMVNIHRDSCTTFLGHQDLLSFFALAENKSIERTRVEMLEKMVQPLGPRNGPPFSKR